MTIALRVIGVPTSAGAHHAGQDLAPAALRDHRLIERLRSAGVQVTDGGDVAGAVWSPDTLDATARNVETVVDVALRVATAVEDAARSGHVPVLLGGDCTITLGMVAGLQRVHDDVRLAYLDGDADLNAPHRTRSGVLDASGVAHLIGVADTPLARIGRQYPMLADHQLSLLGYDRTDPDSFDGAVLDARPRLRHASDADLRHDPEGVARDTVLALTAPGAAVAVHFDVDAVDSRDLALANFPHYGTGVPLVSAGLAFRTLLTAPGLAAVALTEINPTHDPTGQLLDRYVETVVAAVAYAAVR